MARIKKIALAALVAFALAAGGLAVGAGAEQLAGSNPKSFGRESSYQIGFIDDEEIIEQVASSAGTRAKIGRESASLPTLAEELHQVAGSNPDITFGRESS